VVGVAGLCAGTSVSVKMSEIGKARDALLALTVEIGEPRIVEIVDTLMWRETPLEDCRAERRLLMGTPTGGRPAGGSSDAGLA
jgi:hypothetical protein